jgi:hypothetical protein
MASLKVSSGLPYQPAVRGRMAAPRVSTNPCIQIVTRENSPSSAGVVACDRQIGPLALRFDAEMGPDVLERRFHAPARDEPAENFGRSGFEVGCQERLWCQLLIDDEIHLEAVAGAEPVDHPEGLERQRHGHAGSQRLRRVALRDGDNLDSHQKALKDLNAG